MAAKVREHWQFNKSLIERNRVMLDKQLATDVRFIFPNATSGKATSKQGSKNMVIIRAHKYMLISSSPVFWTMFCGDIKEGDTVTIEDVEYAAFMQMLRFIYCEEVQLSSDIVMQILHASKKYMIPSLTQKCIKFLQEQLDASSAAIIYEQALFFEENDLAGKCLEVIQTETQDVLQSREFRSIKLTTLLKILDLDFLNLPEKDVFNACVSWAKFKCGQSTDANVSGEIVRKQLGEALYKIHFPVMTTDELANVVSPTGILNKDEELQCYRYVSADKKPTDMIFPTKQRYNAIGILIEHSYLPDINWRLVHQKTIRISHNISLNQDRTVTGIRILCPKGYTVGVHVETSKVDNKRRNVEYCYGEKRRDSVPILYQEPVIFTNGGMQYADIKLHPVNIPTQSQLNLQIDYSLQTSRKPQDFTFGSVFANRKQICPVKIQTFRTDTTILTKGQMKVSVTGQSPHGQTLLGIFVK